MKHADAERWLGAYMDGELPLHRQQAVEAHLSRCADCMRHLQAMRRLSAHIQAWPAVSRQPEQEEAFCARVVSHLPPRPVRAAPAGGARRPGEFVFPLGIVLTGAFVESAALVTTILTVLVTSGMLREPSVWIQQVATNLPYSPLGVVSPFGWIGQALEGLAGATGLTGTTFSQWSSTIVNAALPLTVFLLFSIVMFLALSGWAGLQLTRNRV